MILLSELDSDSKGNIDYNTWGVVARYSLLVTTTGTIGSFGADELPHEFFFTVDSKSLLLCSVYTMEGEEPFLARIDQITICMILEHILS